MRLFLIAAIVFTVLAGFVKNAEADYFVWQDPVTGLSLSYPDTWDMVNGQDFDDVAVLAAPSGRAHAICRIRSHEDKRYAVFPPRFDSAIQKIEYSVGFWDKYLREYKDPEMYNLQNATGLGRGWGSFAEAGYVGSVPYPEMDRRAVLFAAHYGERVYVVDCSCHKDAFNEWKGPFQSIAKSIDFTKAHHELFTGHYRNFMSDPRILMKGPDGKYVTSY